MLTAKCPSSVNVVSSVTGAPLLHTAACAQMNAACFFLVDSDADVNALNRQGQSALHLACQSAMPALTAKLLAAGANADVQTPRPPLQPHSPWSPPVRTPVKVSKQEAQDKNPFGDDGDDNDDEDEVDRAKEMSNKPNEPIGLQSALHFAVAQGNEENVLAFVEHAE